MLFGTEYLKATYSYVQSVRRFTLDEKDTQKLCLIIKKTRDTPCLFFPSEGRRIPRCMCVLPLWRPRSHEISILNAQSALPAQCRTGRRERLLHACRVPSCCGERDKQSQHMSIEHKAEVEKSKLQSHFFKSHGLFEKRDGGWMRFSGLW